VKYGTCQQRCDRKGLQDRTTPLYVAVTGQHAGCVRALIEAKAEVDAESWSGNACSTSITPGKVLPPFFMLKK
jgi:hypothetical protein